MWRFQILTSGVRMGLSLPGDQVFNSRREQIMVLSLRHAIPAMYVWREFTVAGALLSYGASQTDLFRQVGIQVGRVLSGANPADLPVEQPTKFELVINMKAAKALGLPVPQSILARVDEVIEYTRIRAMSAGLRPPEPGTHSPDRYLTGELYRPGELPRPLMP
jgi:ABC transporter substrate binding protein